MIHAVISCISLVIFTGMALIFTMADMELNPMTQISFLAVSHSKYVRRELLIVSEVGLRSVLYIISDPHPSPHQGRGVLHWHQAAHDGSIGVCDQPQVSS